jgi:DNA primase catalytic core
MNTKIHPATIAEVKDKMNILDVVTPHLHIINRGNHHIALCPFHNEKTPSFTISHSKNIYKCFGCGAAGDPIKFTIEHLGYSFPEAIIHIAQLCNVEVLHIASDKDDGAPHPREAIYTANGYAADYYRRQLETTDGIKTALPYLASRRITSDTIAHYEIGYAPAITDRFTRTAVAAHYTVEALQIAGLTTDRKTDIFRSRIIFPLHNVAGKIVAFAGRGIHADTVPKYMNTPETPAYKKSEHLYGLHQARHHITRLGYVIIAEGHLDTISVYQSGFPNTVATGGTALSDTHARTLARYTRRAVLLFDRDAAGEKAAIAAIRTLHSHHIDTFTIYMAPGADPDVHVNTHSREYVADQLAKPIPYITYLAESIDPAAPPDHTSAQLRIIDDIIAAHPDPIKRNTYIHHLCTKGSLFEPLRRRIAPAADTPSPPRAISHESIYTNLLRALVVAHHYRPDTAPQAKLKKLASHVDHPASAIISLLDEHDAIELRSHENTEIAKLVIDALTHDTIAPVGDPAAHFDSQLEYACRQIYQTMLMEMKNRYTRDPSPALMGVFNTILVEYRAMIKKYIDTAQEQGVNQELERRNIQLTTIAPIA